MANEQHVVIQGYGKVGAPLVKLLSDRGHEGCWYRRCEGRIHVPGGINHITMAEHYVEAGTVVGYPAATTSRPDNSFTINSDIAIPAALGGAIDEKVAETMEASIVVEAANGPTTGEGAEMLASRNIPVVPDVLANAGGVVASYFEWAQDLQGFMWETELFQQRWKRRCLSHSTTSGPGPSNSTSPCAKLQWPLAWKRIAEATELRGLSLIQSHNLTEISPERAMFIGVTSCQ